MSNETAYQHVKRYINEQWEAHRRFLPQGAYAAELAKKDGALKWLEVMKRTSPEPTPFEQPAAPVEEAPKKKVVEFDRELSLRIDQLDKHIDQAKHQGDFARATALRDRKARMFRQIGL